MIGATFAGPEVLDWLLPVNPLRSPMWSALQTSMGHHQKGAGVDTPLCQLERVPNKREEERKCKHAQFLFGTGY